MTDDPFSVICCGLTTLDVLQVIAKLPGPDEKTVAEAVFVDAGGPAANAAATVCALGGAARLVTAIGEGPVGGIASALLGRAGVEIIDSSHGGHGDLAVSTVLVNGRTGQRAVVSTNSRGLASGVLPKPIPLGRAAAVLVDGHYGDIAAALAKSARAGGVPVLMDGGSWKPGTEALLKWVDYAVASSAFVPPGGMDAIEYLAAAGCRFVAQTRGAENVRVLDGGRVIEVDVEAIGAGELVDTLGAGDVLHGALAALVACFGTEIEFPELLRRAARIATESCRYRGARGWTRDSDSVERMRKMVNVGH